jgi:hypothetical protein
MRQEFDFLVAVKGDLDNPRLEVGKHDAWRWLSADELSLLEENRNQSDPLVRRAVEAALTWEAMHKQ